MREEEKQIVDALITFIKSKDLIFEKIKYKKNYVIVKFRVKKDE